MIAGQDGVESVHRHDLRSCGQRVRWFPSTPAGPPDLATGTSKAHKLVALGHWNDEVEVGPMYE